MRTLQLAQDGQIVQAFAPVDLNTAGAAGDWINLALYRRVTVIFTCGVGTAGDDPTLELKQATDNAGAGAKALDFTAIFSKVGATALSGVGVFTENTQAASNTYVDATSAENEAMFVIELDAEMLDVDNDFGHVQLNILDDLANAQLAHAVYVLHGARYLSGVAKSAID